MSTNSSALQMKLQEEVCSDSETEHVLESVAYLVVQVDEALQVLISDAHPNAHPWPASCPSTTPTPHRSVRLQLYEDLALRLAELPEPAAASCMCGAAFH